jgi:multidrug efflux system membrane fusion protein
MRLARAVGIAAAGILIVGSVLFWRFEASLTAKSQSNGSPQQAIPVTADTAQTRDVPVYVEGLGTVQAFNRVNVMTRVSGQITNVFFREGQEVKADDQLFQIDPRQFEAALQQAQATKEKDEAQLESAQLDLQRRPLDKDALASRLVQRTGIISSRPILGGLHHYYFRV